MNTDSDYSEKPSRRTFTKSVAAALAATPFMFSSVKAQYSCGSPNACVPRSPLLRTPCLRLGETPIPEPHEPPIGVGGGALTLECEEEMHREGAIHAGPREHLYDFEKYTYGLMTRLEVVTEYNSAFTYDCYKLDVSGVRSPKLKIWLQRLRRLNKMGKDEYEWMMSDIDPATEPHIFFTYRPTERGFDGAVIESDKKFQDVKKGFKQKETFKHKHAGYGSTRFRIGRWMLINDDGSPLAGECAGRKFVPHPENPGKQTQVEVLGFYLKPRFDDLAKRLNLV